MKIPKWRCPRCSQVGYLEVDYKGIPDELGFDDAKSWYGHVGLHDPVIFECKAPVKDGFDADKNPKTRPCGYKAEFQKKNSRPLPGSLDAKAQRLTEMVDKLSESSLKEMVSKQLSADFMRNDTAQEAIEQLRKRIKELENGPKGSSGSSKKSS